MLGATRRAEAGRLRYRQDGRARRSDYRRSVGARIGLSEDPGTPPHRHPGPAFGYVLEGEPERIIRAGETFWEPGGDVIHYQDGNNSPDSRVRLIVTMMCGPGKPMLVLVHEDELARRKDRRALRPT
jgi:hypothetical protein